MLFNQIKDLLNKNRRLKDIIRRFYFYFGDNISTIINHEKCKSHYEVERVSFKKSSFFGYYDKSPLSKNSELILYHEVDELNKLYHNIILFDISNNSRRKIGKTRATNFQIGSRLQWLSSNEFIFNSFDTNGRPLSIKHDITSGKNSQITSHIFDCYENKFAINLNFKILSKYQPEYGYNYNCENLKNIITKIDLNNGSIKKLFTITEIIKNLNIPTRYDRLKYFANHIIISPNGKKFIFIIRYIDSNSREDFLISYDFRTEKYNYLKNSTFISHLAWMPDDYHVVGFLTFKNKTGFYKIKIDGELYPQLITNDITDGHPSVVDKDNVIIDTYPNFLRNKKLFRLNIQNGIKELIASFYEPYTSNLSLRCDLHPRYYNNEIFIDSNHSEKRGLYRIRLLK